MVVLVVFGIRELTTYRDSKSSRNKSAIEGQKFVLDMLSASAENYERQIKAIANALAAEAVHLSSDQIDAVRAGHPGSSEDYLRGVGGIADHLQARKTAREELPLLIAQLTAVQQRQVDLTRDLSQGVVLRDELLVDVRRKTDKVAAQLGELVALIATSPRIHVTESVEDSSAFAEGDLIMLVDTSHKRIQAPADTPPQDS